MVPGGLRLSGQMIYYLHRREFIRRQFHPNIRAMIDADEAAILLGKDGATRKIPLARQVKAVRVQYS